MKENQRENIEEIKKMKVWSKAKRKSNEIKRYQWNENKQWNEKYQK